MIKPLRAAVLLSCMSLGSLASDVEGLVPTLSSLNFTVSNVQSNSEDSAKLTLEELVKPIDSFNWLLGLFRYGNQLSRRLGPAYVQLLNGLEKCNYKGGIENCTTKITDKLLRHIMKSKSKPDMEKVLQAADPYINDATAAHLIASHVERINKSAKHGKSLSLKKPTEPTDSNDYNEFKDLSSTINFLSKDKTKAIDKNCDNAKISLNTKHKLTDSSIWFLLTQQELYTTYFGKFSNVSSDISAIIECNIILHADTNIEHLFGSMGDIKRYPYLTPRWYKYAVEKLPFNNIPLYNIEINWESIGQSLLLEDPKLATEVLNVNHYDKNQRAYNYLLLLQDNPAKRLARLEPSEIDAMYSCFIMLSNIWSLGLNDLRDIHKLPKGKIAELANNLSEFKEGLWRSKAVQYQSELPYLSLASVFGNDDTIFNMDSFRAFAPIPKTLELLDITEGATLELPQIRASFSGHLIKTRNWDEAVGEHFHYFISLLIIDNCKKITESLIEYIGVNIHGTLSILKDENLARIDNTLDKVPRHLDGYFKIIDNQVHEEVINALEHLKIAIRGSMLNSEAANVAYKRDFVYYQLKNLKSFRKYSQSPVFVELACMCCKYGNYKPKKIKSFFHFEQLVYKYFPGLVRMDLERGFQRLNAKNTFSVALGTFIDKNFEYYEFPLVLRNLQALVDALIDPYLMAIMELQIEKMPVMTLLKAAYLALDDTRHGLPFAFMKHLVSIHCLNG